MGCAFAGCRESRRSASALDGRTVRQRRLTSSFRLANPVKKLLTLSCTAALLPKHRFPVTSCLTQPQTASSGLKSGLYAAGSGPGSPSMTASPRHGAPARCPRSRSAAPSAFSATGPGRPPRFRHCCIPPIPSTPPHRGGGFLHKDGLMVRICAPASDVFLTARFQSCSGSPLSLRLVRHHHVPGFREWVAPANVQPFGNGSVVLKPMWRYFCC